MDVLGLSEETIGNCAGLYISDRLEQRGGALTLIAELGPETFVNS